MKKRVSNVILVIAIGVFLFSGYKLCNIFAEYNKGTSEYEAIQHIAIKQNVPMIEEEMPKEEPTFIVDFEMLSSKNPDTVAWIRFGEPSQINYPVVRGKDNKKYLSTTFEGKKNGAGTLFVDYRNTGEFTDKNTFIYGHNMKNGSMFGKLRKYKDIAFCQENPYFYIYTPDGKELTYQIFAVGVVNDTSETYRRNFDDDQEFRQYIEYIRSISIYSTDVEVEAESTIVSLSTCTSVREDERLVVHGVKVEKSNGGE